MGTLAIAAAIPTAAILGPGAATVIGGVAAAIGAIATGAFIGVRGKRDVNGPNEIDIANTDVDLRIIFKMFEELDEKHDCLKQYTCTLATRDPAAYDASQTALMTLMTAASNGTPFYKALISGFYNKDISLCMREYPKCRSA